jgi:transcriptional antiterminator NusG
MGGEKIYYAARVRDKREDFFIRCFQRKHPAFDGLKIYFPKRELRERKSGNMKIKTHPVFSGYVFLEIDKGDNIANYAEALKTTKGFYRFLHSNARVAKLAGRDLEIILRFIKLRNASAGVSKVYFNENNKIVVVEGVMKGLEGNIVKVDRRKGRAKVRLDIYCFSHGNDNCGL